MQGGGGVVGFIQSLLLGSTEHKVKDLVIFLVIQGPIEGQKHHFLKHCCSVPAVPVVTYDHWSRPPFCYDIIKFPSEISSQNVTPFSKPCAWAYASVVMATTSQ